MAPPPLSFLLPILGRRCLALALSLSLFLMILGLCASSSATASCKLLGRPNFVHVPTRLAVLSRADDAELFNEVSYINSNQDYYELTLLPGIEPTSVVERTSSDYDAVLVLDQEMMVGDLPKYNKYLRVYRDKNLSDETMIVDSRFDSKHRIGFTFLQIAASSTRAQSLLIEIGLMALASNLKLDDDLLSYYRKVDSISAYQIDQISQTAFQDILNAREQIIVACFLRGEGNIE